MSKAQADWPTFAEWLALKIEERFGSDSDFARRAGISPSTVSRWVAGKSKPDPGTVEKIAPLLGASPFFLHKIIYFQEGIEQVTNHTSEADNSRVLRDLRRLLSSETLSAEERIVIETLVEHVIDPYRRHLPRGRRTADTEERAREVLNLWMRQHQPDEEDSHRAEEAEG